MANLFTNKKVDLTTTNATTLYTVPTATTSIIKSILVSEDSGNADTITVTVMVSAFPESSDTNIDLTIEVVADGTVYKVVADVAVKSNFLFVNVLAKVISLRFCFFF